MRVYDSYVKEFFKINLFICFDIIEMFWKYIKMVCKKVKVILVDFIFGK